MDLSEVHIGFLQKNRTKQITQEKSNIHVSLNELPTSELAG